MAKDEEYNKKVGERVKQFREVFGLSQMDLLRTIGSKSLETDNKANLISMIEHGKRSLTERNIRILCEKYNVQPGYFRLETSHMTQKEERQSIYEKSKTADDMRTKYLEMILTTKKFEISYSRENDFLHSYECKITDPSGETIIIDQESLYSLILDFEDHFAFQIQRIIDRESWEKEQEKMNQTDYDIDIMEVQ